MPLLTARGLASDVQTATSTIRDVVGVDPRPWFRCPFGAIDSGTRTLAGLARLGYRNVGWNVDSRDWASRAAAGEVRRIVDGVRVHGDGAIVLMHGWPRTTAAALPHVISELRESGADFVTVDQLPVVPARAGWDSGPELSEALLLERRAT
jgi:peptidoglycan/xylan/chitin deacetylase (PgdA/CDA1 family)